MTNVTLTADHRDNNPLSRGSSVLRDSVTAEVPIQASAGCCCADNFGDNVDRGAADNRKCQYL